MQASRAHKVFTLLVVFAKLGRNEMPKLLEGEVEIFRGDGREIGRGDALLLAKEGAKVVVNDFGGVFDVCMQLV